MLKFIKQMVRRYGEDNISGKAAALAYFAIFSIGPLLFIIFAVVGLVLQDDVIKARILTEVNQTIGPQAQPLVKNIINGSYLSKGISLAFFIGLIGLILAAIGIFGQLHRSFNEIFGIKAGPGAGIKAVFIQKFISLSLVGVISFLLLASLVASAAISILTKELNDNLIPGPAFTLLDFIISMLILSLLITILYRTLPEAKMPWKPLFTTSLIVAAFFGIGKIVLSYIITKNATVSAFGAAASLVAFLLWVFYSGQLVYLGALGASIYANNKGIELKPRYKSYDGVLRVKQTSEPMGEAPFGLKVKKKFKQGLARGWRRGTKS